MIFFFTILSLSLKPRRSHIQKKDIDGFACKTCIGLAEGARVYAQEGYSNNEITVKLLSQCQTVAQADKAYYPMCQELSTKYISILVHLVGQVEDSTKICVKLGYCSDLTRRSSGQNIKRNLRYLNKNLNFPRK